MVADHQKEEEFKLIKESKVINKNCDLDILDFVRITSTMPAKVYGLYPSKGEIKIGSDADITIWDTKLNITLSDNMVVDGSKYNPYSGMNICCWPNEVILRGNTIVKDNLIKSKPGSGKFLSTKLSEYI